MPYDLHWGPQRFDQQGALAASLSPSFSTLPGFSSSTVSRSYNCDSLALLQMRQQISFQQGALAPLAASAALFGGFLLIKYLPWINLQTVSNAYFFLIGSAAVTGALLPPFRHAVSH